MVASHAVLLHHVGVDDVDATALVAAWDPGWPRCTVVLTWGDGDRAAADRVADRLALVAPQVEVRVAPARPVGQEPAAYLRRSVIPMLERIRATVIDADRRGWRERFSLTLSLSDADPVWVSALLASTRSMRPALVLRGATGLRWHEFGEVEHIPPAPPSTYDAPEVVRITEEMCRWRDEYLSATGRARANGEDELYDFWLRKGRRSVLSVLLVDDGGGPSFFRGCNLEVSLPTGTLCAERNAIGTALAVRPDLKRHHVRMVAVLSLGGPGEVDGTGGNPLGPCGACREWLLKIDEVNPDLKVVTFTDRSCAQVIVQSLGQVP